MGAKETKGKRQVLLNNDAKQNDLASNGHVRMNNYTQM